MRAREEDENRRELSWMGSEGRALFRLAWPIAISMLSYATMTTVDTLFVGHLGTAALAGVGLGGISAFMLLAFCFGMLRGVKVLASQARGANRPELLAPITGAGVVVGAALGALGLVAGQWLAQLMPGLSSSVAAGRAASAYLELRAIGAPMVLVGVALRESSYGGGDTVAPMRASIVANLANVGLDAVFIFGFGWGVEGAALASVTATAVQLGCLMWLGPRVELADLRRGLAHLGRLYEVGAATGFQFLIEVGAFATLSLMISNLAELEMAAHQIALQVCHFSFLPAAAIAEAASVMGGEAVGAGRDDLIRRVAARAMLIAGGYAALCSTVFGLGGGAIAAAFTGDPELVARAASLLYLAAVFQVADAANVVARGMLRGAGDVRLPTIVGVVLAWVITPPMCYALGYGAGLGALGGWLGLCVEIIAGAAFFWLRLVRGGWMAAARRSRAALES